MYDGLADKLQIAIEKYYQWWIEQYTNEKVYSFCFFSEPAVSYAGATVFTEEGLLSVAKEYKNSESYKDKSLECLAKELRWSACDSPHHFENEDIFSSVNKQLEEISAYTHSEEDQVLFNAHIKTLYSLFVAALKGFRESSLHGEQNIILSVWFGDQDEENISYFIKSCNSPELVEKFYDEWE